MKELYYFICCILNQLLSYRVGVICFGWEAPVSCNTVEKDSMFVIDQIFTRELESSNFTWFALLVGSWRWFLMMAWLTGYSLHWWFCYQCCRGFYYAYQYWCCCCCWCCVDLSDFNASVYAAAASLSCCLLLAAAGVAAVVSVFIWLPCGCCLLLLQWM